MAWFKDTFLKSFGNCEGKRISEKQYNVFMNNLSKFCYESGNHIWNGVENFYKFDGKRIVLQESPVVGGKTEYFVSIDDGKRYRVFGTGVDLSAIEIVNFKTEEKMNEWLKRFCRWSGVAWNIYDLSSFLTPLTSRTVMVEHS